MITLYRWDSQGIYSHNVEVDPRAAMPANSTTTPAPETVGEQVAKWIGGGWIVLESMPPLPAEPLPSADDISARRYRAEIAGITINGMSVETDDRAKLLINGAALEAVIDPGYAMQWKAGEVFVELTGAQVIGIARAVRAHVQACFDREAELLAELEVGTLTEEMLETGWPVA